MKTRDLLIGSRENLGWCKPLKHKSENVIIAVNEGTIVSVLVDGEEQSCSITSELIKKLAQRLNEDYEEYQGYSDTEILLEADFEELGCADCPWFDVCEAMDE